MKIKRNDFILGFLIVSFVLLSIGNAIEYFFVQKSNMRHVRGVVKDVKVEMYNCEGRSRYSYSTCATSVITVLGYRKKFRIRDYADAYEDPFITWIEPGDTIDIYVPKWYQRVVTLGNSGQFYRLEGKNGVYDVIDQWKRRNKWSMIVFAVFAVIFTALYIVQYVTIKQLNEGKNV